MIFLYFSAQCKPFPINPSQCINRSFDRPCTGFQYYKWHLNYKLHGLYPEVLLTNKKKTILWYALFVDCYLNWITFIHSGSTWYYLLSTSENWLNKHLTQLGFSLYSIQTYTNKHKKEEYKYKSTKVQKYKSTKVQNNKVQKYRV